MNRIESDHFMEDIDGLFAPAVLTEQQKKLWAEKIRTLEYQRALTALKQHRLNRKGDQAWGANAGEFLDTYNGARRSSQPPSMSGLEILRQHSRSGPDISDQEMILRYFRSCWSRCWKSEGYRYKFTRECKAMLFQIGLNEAQAEFVTEDIFAEVVPV
jgi:hypothetical protein